MAVKTKPRSRPIHIPAYCSYSKLVPIAKLTPNPRNPNKHPDNQIAALAKIIAANGWRAPIVVSKRSGFIVRGHGRLKAAMVLGLASAPVDFQKYKNDAEEWRDLLADNKIAELAEMDYRVAAQIIADLPEEDRAYTGYPDHEVAPMLSALEAGEEPAPPPEPSGPVQKGTMFKATLPQAKVIRRAIDTLKANEKPSMSDGRALELICADFSS